MEVDFLDRYLATMSMTHASTKAMDMLKLCDICKGELILDECGDGAGDDITEGVCCITQHRYNERLYFCGRCDAYYIECGLCNTYCQFIGHQGFFARQVQGRFTEDACLTYKGYDYEVDYGYLTRLYDKDVKAYFINYIEDLDKEECDDTNIFDTSDMNIRYFPLLSNIGDMTIRWLPTGPDGGWYHYWYCNGCGIYYKLTDK